MEDQFYTGDDHPTVSELAHYGTKGMKWGVRKKDSSDSSGGGTSRKSKRAAKKIEKAKAKAKANSSDYDEAQKAKKVIKYGGTKKLSNKELQAVIERGRLEAQYKSQSKGGSAAKERLGKAVVDSVADVGMAEATRLAPKGNQQAEKLLAAAGVGATLIRATYGSGARTYDTRKK